MPTSKPTRPHNMHLLTPLDWQRDAIKRAAEESGTTLGSMALVEANRYAMLDAVLAYVRELERANRELEAQVSTMAWVIDRDRIHKDGGEISPTPQGENK